MSDAGSPPSDLSARLAQLSPERRALLEKKMREMAAASSAAPKPDTITHRVSVGQEAPLSYTQELLWMFERAAPHVAVYNSPRYYRVRGALDVPALRHALDTH